MMKEVLGEKKHGFMPVLQRIAEAKKITVEQIDIKHEVGMTAGDVYKLLEGKQGMFLRDIKAQLEPKGPLVKVAIGWLLHENKIELKATKDGVKVKLK